MSFSEEDLDWIFTQTAGRCHICKKTLAWRNYGTTGRRGSWEVDHSKPRARGGTDRRSNLLAACVSCNRSKQDGSTRAARAANGLTRRPMSEDEIASAKSKNAAIVASAGAAAGLAVGGPVGAVIGGLGGFAIGGSLDVDE